MITKHDIANAFHKALGDEAWEDLLSLLTDNASWLLPGDNLISSPVTNAEELVSRARLIASYHMKFDLKHILVSKHNFGLYQFNTAGNRENKFEQFVLTRCEVEDGKISQIETFVSDLDGFNAFFNQKPKV